MGARLIKDLSVFLAASLWAVMLYLQAPIIFTCKAKFIYPSLEDFNKDFLLLSQELQNNVKKMLVYDNYFVLFFGLFLVGYIFTLKSILGTPKRTEKISPVIKERLGIFLNIILILSIVYMISDWTENRLLCKVIDECRVSFAYFSILQILKWSLGVFVLISCIFIDRTYFKNKLNIVSRFGICMGIIGIIVGILYFIDKYF